MSVEFRNAYKVITGTQTIGLGIYTTTPPTGTTFSITGGADQALFTIDPNTGELSFTSTMLYQSPRDFDRDGIYDVIITAIESDGTVNTGTLGIEVSLDGTLPEFKDPTITYTVDGNEATVITISAQLTDDLSGLIGGLISMNIEHAITGQVFSIGGGSIDDEGNQYEITSEFGEMGPDNPDIILMTNVKATIRIYNIDPIIITSNFAKYNVKNYDTNFKENVLVKHVDNKLNAENLDLSFQSNLMLMYNNIIYQNLDTKLFADKIEIDLITKDSKIIMNDKKSKIKMIRKK